MDWIKQILPTIGNIIGGPLGGAAVSAVAGALGISEPTQEKIEKALSSGKLTAEQMAALQAADLQLKTKMAELGIEAEKLQQADRSSARQMQVATGSIVPQVLAVLFVAFYLIIVSLLLTGQMKLWENSTLTMLLGGVTSGVTMILGFYFGASHVANIPDLKK
jgi:hypothetical protein